MLLYGKRDVQRILIGDKTLEIPISVLEKRIFDHVNHQAARIHNKEYNQLHWGRFKELRAKMAEILICGVKPMKLSPEEIAQRAAATMLARKAAIEMIKEVELTRAPILIKQPDAEVLNLL